MDRLLLDTCVFLWWQADDPKLTIPMRRSIADRSLSAAQREPEQRHA